MTEPPAVRRALRDGVVHVVQVDYNRRKIWKKIRRHWNSLSARQRRVAELHSGQGYTFSSVAWIMGLKRSTITTHWMRILRKIDL